MTQLLRSLRAKFRLRLARWMLVREGAEVGRDLWMYTRAVCHKHPAAVIRIGNGVTIRNTLKENLAGITHRTVLCAAEAGAVLSIGNGVGISGAILYAAREIVIEDRVSLGAGARVYDTDFHPIDSEKRRANDRSAIVTKPVRIKQDAFIGAGAMILKGVTIGERSVVGAGAVVTRDVADDTVVAGVPARIVARLSAAVRA